MVKRKIWRFIKDFNLIPLIIVLICFLIIGKFCTKIWDPQIIQSRILRSFYPNYHKLLYLGLWGVWIFLAFNMFLKGIYYRVTDRDFFSDKAHFNRSFFELLHYFKDADPHKLNLRHFPEETWKESSDFILGQSDGKLIVVPADKEYNVAIFGPPGSGKTAGPVITNACQFDGSVLAVDIKGDIYNYVSKNTKRNILLFCPEKPSESCHYNPLAGINEMSSTERKLFIQNMASVLIPANNPNGENYFEEAGQDFFRGIVHLLLSENPNISFPEIIHAILPTSYDYWGQRVENSDCREAKEIIMAFKGNNEKNLSGAYKALTKGLEPFSNVVLDELLSPKGRCLSFKNLEGGFDIYLQISQEHLDAYAPIFTLIIQSFSTAFTKRADSSSGQKIRPILMLLDEFPQLTFSYNLINSNLSTLRSKAVKIVIIQQNIAQLEKKYGRDGSRVLIGNCHYQLILGSNDPESSKRYSDLFGEKRVLKSSNTLSYRDKNASRSTMETIESVYPPTDFSALPSENKVIIFYDGKHTKVDKINCYK